MSVQSSGGNGSSKKEHVASARKRGLDAPEFFDHLLHGRLDASKEAQGLRGFLAWTKGPSGDIPRRDPEREDSCGRVRLDDTRVSWARVCAGGAQLQERPSISSWRTHRATHLVMN